MHAHIDEYHRFECPCCSHVATTPEDLEAHCERVHIRCTDCGAWVKDGPALHEHMRRAHEFKCPIKECGMW